MIWNDFEAMVETCQDHDVFGHVSNGYPTRPQFLAAFHRFGCDGKGVRIGFSTNNFGISGGSVDKFTWNVVKDKEPEFVLLTRQS
ncbi:hypothetical protein BC941DRAFT_470275 [Chlamydoabsidia padenii]|nr:hypothetical protein BC941DRAFT_470275 [Chlamydoabsidia padenii]